MKKNILTLLTSLVFLTSTDAQAQEWCGESTCCYENNCCVDKTNFYAKILGGVNFLENVSIDRNKSSYEPGYVVGASLGYFWRYGLSVEAEYAYRRNEINKIHFFGQGSADHGHFRASSCMANLFWNMPLASWGCAFQNIQPFVGAGLGYDFQHMHSSTSRIIFDQSWNHFSWQLMAGLIYPIFCNTDFSLEYKFHQGSSHFNNHSLDIGIQYKFGL